MSSLLLATFVSALSISVCAQSSQTTAPTGTSPAQLATGLGPVITSPPFPQLFIPKPIVAQPANAPFPSVGSVPRDFSQQGYDNLWSIVGSVQSPPFTTTVVPSTPIPLPSAPPPLYPTWYAPEPKDVMANLSFPAGFKFGVASAAYQSEGAAKSEGKGPSQWDWASRQTGVVLDGTNGDITDLHYFLYKEDIARIAALGVNTYSFSISWARIFPFAVQGSPLNQQGLDHYSDVIDYAISLGVEPVVTLLHFDVPLAPVAYYGGFTSSDIIDDFVNFAVTIFNAFNGKVKTWVTFNEPAVFCPFYGSYPFNATIAAGLNSTSAPYECARNLILAHATAVQQFRALNISGEIGFKNNGIVNFPWRANNTEDAEAVERTAAFGLGIYCDPIYTTGDWPQILKDTLPESILPPFSDEEKQLINGTADFFAIDAYTVDYSTAPPNGIAACVADMTDPNWPVCSVNPQYDTNNWGIGPYADPGSPWLAATPGAVRYELQQLHTRWPSNKLYISEYGFCEPFENNRPVLFQITEDVDRTNYYMTYLGEVLLSIHEDGIPVAGAFSWAILDNAEWFDGLSVRFGIQYVNYSSPTLERTFKRSALALSEFFASHL